MAKPLRFRYTPGTWTPDRVEAELHHPLDANIGARSDQPWFRSPPGYDARRFEMDDGSLALFCWTTPELTAGGERKLGPSGTNGGPGGYWLGNTETPSRLWGTQKYGFAEVPTAVSEWAERELLAGLWLEEPWLEAYPTLARFFLPVFCSKDGAETTRSFFADHAAGFPEATRDEALGFYEGFLSTGALDAYRDEMAAKLGTSETLDLTRMAATMGEFDAAKLLFEAGYAVTPEIEVSTGHSLDFRAAKTGEETVLIEVTRPLPPGRREASSPASAVKETVGTKTRGQLEAHGGGAVLFVDCSSFPIGCWESLTTERPDVAHRPTIVFRMQPSTPTEGYRLGNVPLELGSAIEWRDE